MRKIVVRLAAIQHPPRRFFQFFPDYEKRVQNFWNSIAWACTTVINECQTAMARAGYPEDGKALIEWMFDNACDDYELRSLREWIGDRPLNEAMHRRGILDWEKVDAQARGYYVDGLRREAEFLQDYQRRTEYYWRRSLEGVLDSFRSNSEQEPSANLLKALNILQPAYADEMVQRNATTTQKMEAYERYYKREYYGDPEPMRPESEDVEVLYHASTKAVQLYKEGFQAEFSGNKGLGGSSDIWDEVNHKHMKATSFTSDLYVAKEIARSLKEAVAIARGEYKGHQLVRFLKETGMWEKTWDMYRNSTGNHFDPNDRQLVLELFNAYLWANSKKRYNPVFFGAKIEDYQDIDPKQIGVVSAKVNMRYPGIDYKHAEHEYRVPYPAILGVVDLIQ